MAALEDEGVAAVVLPSLFEEQIVADEEFLHATLEAGTELFAEAIDYFPPMQDYNTGPDRYLELVERARARLSIPVIASLNASSPGGWIRYAELLQDAGADALELNLYQVHVDRRRTSSEVEDADVELDGRGGLDGRDPGGGEAQPVLLGVRVVRGARLAGHRSPGWCCSTASTNPTSTSRPSTWCRRSSCRRPGSCACPCAGSPCSASSWPARWRPPRASTTAHDVAKALLVGADVAMTTSALLHHGPGRVATMERQLVEWMTEHDYASVDQLRGSVRREAAADPEAFERSQLHAHAVELALSRCARRLRLPDRSGTSVPVGLPRDHGTVDECSR